MEDLALNASLQRPLYVHFHHPANDAYTSPSMIACTIFAVLAGVLLLALSTEFGLSLLTHFISRFGGTRSQVSVPGCKRIGIPLSESNLIHDEYDAKYRKGDANGDGKSWKIKSLWIYPVKSCAGVELSVSTVVKTGLEYDRLFSFAQKGKDGVWNFSTTRSHPMMVMLQTEVWSLDPSASDFSKDLESVKTNGVVRIIFPNPRPQSKLGRVVAALRGKPDPSMVAIDLPLQPTPEQIKSSYTLEPFKIWKDCVSGINMSSHIRPELREFLQIKPGVEFALFRSHEMREVYRDAPTKDVLGWQPIAGYNDAYPVNLVGISSLQATEELQEVARQTAIAEKGHDYGKPPLLGARRFRANIIIEGTPEFEEEEWKYIHLGDEDFYVVARCVRCKLPNVDPDTGVQDRNYPDVAIRKFRQVDKGAPRNTGCLAVQMVPRKELGKVHVGDVISVKERGEHVYIPMGL